VLTNFGVEAKASTPAEEAEALSNVTTKTDRKKSDA
jgi:hypothetical protein